MLRHTVATLAYRAGKALRGAPPGFSNFDRSRRRSTPGQILAHLCDLFDWALSLADGGHHVAQLHARRLGAGHGALLRRAGSVRPPPRHRRVPVRCEAGTPLSGTGGRRPHPRRPDRHAAPPGRIHDTRRKLLCGRNHRRPLRRRPGPAGQRVLRRQPRGRALAPGCRTSWIPANSDCRCADRAPGARARMQQVLYSWTLDSSVSTTNGWHSISRADGIVITPESPFTPPVEGPRAKATLGKSGMADPSPTPVRVPVPDHPPTSAAK